MTREEYFKKRQEMIDEAQKLLDDEKWKKLKKLLIK